jgi:hypothetical protein
MSLSLNNYKRYHTVYLLLLGLLSFGGGTGRFSFGLGLFDFLLILMLLLSLLNEDYHSMRLDKSNLIFFLFFSLILFIGFLSFYLNFNRLEHDYFLTEIRFFIYIPILYYLSTRYMLNLFFLNRFLPYVLSMYIFVWTFLLNDDGFIFSFFNSSDNLFIGDQERISGPSVLILVPLVLILIKEKSFNLISLILYLFLILIIFIKTGGRTYFIYYLFPIFFLLYLNRKSLKNFIVSLGFLLISFYLIKELTSSVFFERFVNISNATEDSSFRYRVYNVEEMVSRLSGYTLWFGNGFGSNYEVDLFGWKSSFFLDNTFVTIVYKIGIVGLMFFLIIFVLSVKYIPKDIYLFELCSLILIALISYHIILNPVFILGYFIVLNYYKNVFKRSLYEFRYY